MLSPQIISAIPSAIAAIRVPSWFKTPTPGKPVCGPPTEQEMKRIKPIPKRSAFTPLSTPTERPPFRCAEARPDEAIDRHFWGNAKKLPTPMTIVEPTRTANPA